MERESGLLPPFGLTKHISSGRGSTCLFGIPVAFFEVRGSQLVYRGLPLQDDLSRRPDGSWTGRGRFLGREFCSFRLVQEATG